MKLLQGFVILTSLFLTGFYLWNESRKDGFDEEKVLDIFGISLVTSYLVAKAVTYALSHTFMAIPEASELPFYLLGFGAGAWYTCRRYKWSMFRVSDILTLSVLFGAGAFFMLTALIVNFELVYLFVAICLIMSSLLLSRYRNIVFKSGYIFIMVSLLVSCVGLVRFHNIKNLPFSLFLITLSVLAIKYRIKIDMIKPKISPDLFKQLVGRLKTENSKLKSEEYRLKKADPYMKEGRVVDNAELVDDAVEDVDKTYHEARVNLIQTARLQVRRALAKAKIGTYGICETCHTPIDIARLKAYPQATKCLDCSEKSES